jgi:hypothetical protein
MMTKEASGPRPMEGKSEAVFVCAADIEMRAPTPGSRILDALACLDSCQVDGAITRLECAFRIAIGADTPMKSTELGVNVKHVQTPLTISISSAVDYLKLNDIDNARYNIRRALSIIISKPDGLN